MGENNDTKLSQEFTEKELCLAKQLAYENWQKESTEIGFVFKGMWITNPFLEETGRFEFTDLDAMCDYYGRENVCILLKKLLEQEKL